MGILGILVAFPVIIVTTLIFLFLESQVESVFPDYSEESIRRVKMFIELCGIFCIGFFGFKSAMMVTGKVKKLKKQKPVSGEVK